MVWSRASGVEPSCLFLRASFQFAWSRRAFCPCLWETKLLLSRLILISSVLAFGHLDMLSFFSLRLCVGVDNALIKGEIANTFSICVQLVVMSDCQRQHFHSIFYFFCTVASAIGDWHTAVCRATCFLVRVVQVPSCGSGSRR